MASNYTENYALCQWEPTDQVQRTDFNADNAKLDAALAALDSGKADQSALTSLSNTVAQKASQSALNTLNTTVQQIQADLTKLTFGTYTGDDASSRTISLGFTPKAVLVFTSFGATYDGLEYSSSHYGGLAYTGHPVQSKSASKLVLQVVSNGFSVAYESVGTGDRILSNEMGVTYYYIAFS